MRKLLIGLMMVSSLSGCVQYTAGVSSTEVSVGKMSDTLLVADNPMLGRQLELTRAGVEPMADGRSMGQASIKSLITSDLSLQYRFYWFDVNGTQLDGSAWLPIIVHGKQEVQLQSMSESTQARSFKLYVREILK